MKIKVKQDIVKKGITPLNRGTLILKYCSFNK